MNYKTNYSPVNTSAQANTNPLPEEGVKVNGMEQVIEMLRYADPQFRESLLKRIGQRDPNLAVNLRKLFRR